MAEADGCESELILDAASPSYAEYDGAMTRYLHTMYRITDPEKSRRFYEALGLEFRRDMDIVRDGERRRRTTSSASPARKRSSS